MKQQILWLTYTSVMTGLFWVPYVLNRIKEIGVWGAIGQPNADGVPHAPWARRAMRAHKNAVENLVIFAPLVLTLQGLGIATPATVNACAIYFFARLIHFIVFATGLPVVRTLAFFTGFVCQLYLAYVILISL